MRKINGRIIVVLVVIAAIVIRLLVDQTENQSDTGENTVAEDIYSITTLTGEEYDISEIDLSSIGKLGMVINDVNADDYQPSYYNGMVSYAKKIGIELKILDSKGDAEIQSEQVDSLIEEACSVIMLWPVDSRSAVEDAKKIAQAGIVCMTANTDIDEDGRQYAKCFVGPSNYEEGKMIAEQMIKDIGENGNIAEIHGKTGYMAYKERSAGMQEVIKQAGITLLDSQTSDGSRDSCRQIAENYLVAYGEGELSCIFCYDDDCAIGAVEAIESAGRNDVKVYAAAADYNLSLDYIANGKIEAAALQSPYDEARAALNIAAYLASGKEPFRYEIHIQTPVITEENVEAIRSEYAKLYTSSST